MTSERIDTGSAPHERELPVSARNALRDERVAAIPRWYSPWAHLLVPSLAAVCAATYALLSLRDVRPWEWLAIPVTYLVSNATEWWAHRDLLHRKSKIAPLLYERHVPVHHVVYVTDDMAMRSRNEWRLVLMPAYAIVLILLSVVPIGAGLWLVGLPNVAVLFFATSTFFTVSYEWLHLAYHLPESSFVGRTWWVRVLRRHHAVHHDPALMRRWNFNVTVPLWDWVRGTIHKHAGDSLAAEAEASTKREANDVGVGQRG
ncbi:MAG: sterol desaturase family protein [Deltaproteobacteria bacterium]|nr:sterol desaturase family protein [Deltaproteobacteria bacterium]